MRCTNGETQEATRELNTGYIFDKRGGLGEVQDPGGSDGFEQVRPDQVDCSRQDSPRATVEYGETPVGKILERLEFIERAYISYVKSHQERLEVRLSESKQKEQEFRDALQQIKDEIYNLVSNQQQETQSKSDA